jgi:tubulin polyglutamylase TTLL4
VKSLSQNQKYNHFPKTFQLGRKDNLWKNFKRFKRKFPLDYNYHPQAFIIPEEFNEFKQFAKSNPSFSWIMKPLASSRGRGIRLFTSWNDIPKECLICKYIEKPHLIQNKKYDLRIYVLITSFTPLKIFLFREGLVRFASEKYTKKDKDNIFVHLTNYAVNKKNKNYDKNDDDGSGSKWTIIAYEKYFIENNMHEKYKFIWERIKDIIIKTLITAAEESANYSKVYSKHENVLFELYGFDIIIDSDFNPWLLEVNVNPSLNCDTDLDYNVKTNLITDILNIIGLRPFEEEFPEENAINGTNDNNSYRKTSNNFYNSNNKSNEKVNINNGNKPNNNGNLNKDNLKARNVNNAKENNSNKNNLLPVIKNKINNNNNNNSNYPNSINMFNSISISQVRIENRRNFSSEEPDYNFNFPEEIVKGYYQSFLKTYEDEIFRSKFTNFDCIFPINNNCKNYLKFFKSLDDESIVLLKWILSKKPIDKFY